VDLVDQGEFDTIYHQHLCYFSVTALHRLFSRHDLYLNQVERTSIHGGSLRLYIERRENRSPSVRTLLDMEAERGVDRIHFFENFADRIATVKSKLRMLLDQLQEEGNRVVGYGAAAKATTLLSYCDIDGNDLDYVVDLNPYKHGRYMGGNHLPIYPTEKMVEDQPDYALILAWNFADEIMDQQAEFARCGGRFIIPIPRLEVIGPESLK
jgi:hypothetical protein